MVSGPSGSGKTSLCRALHEAGECVYSISCTTRGIREGERDGIDYHFMSPEEFRRREAAGDFLEHASVHGNSYGTLKESVVGELERGRDVVMDIDVQGAAQVRGCADEAVRGSLVDVFVNTASLEELQSRLAGRATDSEKVVALRLENAKKEIEHADEYARRIVSGTREEDYAALLQILRQARQDLR